MYHTHVNDIRQQMGGLYGGFVVIGPEEEWDPEHDRALVIGNSAHEGGMHLNGMQQLPDAELVAGESYKFRVMNIPLANAVQVRIVRDGYPVRWRALAKDGADFPESDQTLQLADFTARVGETADFEFIPDPGVYTLEVRAPRGRLHASQTIHVAEPPSGEEEGDGP